VREIALKSGNKKTASMDACEMVAIKDATPHAEASPFQTPVSLSIFQNVA
jgi:hypothetical protein